MRSALKSVYAAAVVLVLLSGGLTMVGCNTVEGAGKDAKSVGAKVEDTARDAKN